MFKTDTLDRVRKITKVDAQQLLIDYIEFNDNDKKLINDYYGGKTKTLPVYSFNFLNALLSSFKRLSVLLVNNKNSFVFFEDIEFSQWVDDIITSLNLIKKSAKFQRSSVSQDNFTEISTVKATLSQYQTLESLSREFGDPNWSNNWADIFLDNKLKQEDYTPAGGNLLKVRFLGTNNLNIESVVDNITDAQRTYGIDLNRRLTFVEEDLETLSYLETLIQSAEIAATLKRGDVPERPSDGIDSKLVVGTTRGAISLPVLFRQLYRNFSKDDSFKGFSIEDFQIENDSLVVNIKVETRAGEFQEISSRI